MHVTNTKDKERYVSQITQLDQQVRVSYEQHKNQELLSEEEEDKRQVSLLQSKLTAEKSQQHSLMTDAAATGARRGGTALYHDGPFNAAAAAGPGVSPAHAVGGAMDALVSSSKALRLFSRADRTKI